jgi:hypothetical protein
MDHIVATYRLHLTISVQYFHFTQLRLALILEKSLLPMIKLYLGLGIFILPFSDMFSEMSPNTALLEDPEQQVIPSCFF